MIDGRDVGCNSVRKLPTFVSGLERSRKTDDRDILVLSQTRIFTNFESIKIGVSGS
jgi:hypothetical protein